jgi:class 3 adenylate cyclase
LVAVFVATLSIIFAFQGNLPFFPETKLSFFADPFVKLFNYRPLDPNISIFDYDSATPITTWMFNNYLVVGIAIFTTLLAYKIQLRNAREEIYSLLTNMLPPSIVARMSARTHPDEIIADGHDDVSLLMADLVGSTSLSVRLTPQELVSTLNRIFAEFDDIVDKYGLEKIKTMGDGYFVAGGAPDFREDHLENMIDCAIAMRKALGELVSSGTIPKIELRIGIHAGQVVAGVIGKRKFAYDLWGYAVNLASRMEHTGISGEIQVSEEVCKRMIGKYRFLERGYVEVGKDDRVKAYILIVEN